MTIPLPIKVMYRNTKGHLDLLAYFYKWDRHCRKEFIVTALVFFIFAYSALTWNTPYDIIVMLLELGVILIQLGWPPSLLPMEYRPSHDHIEYTVESSTHIAYDELSFLMAYVRPAPVEDKLGFRNPIAGWGICKESPLTSEHVNDTLMLRTTLPWTEEKNDTNYIRSRHQLRYIAIRVANKIQNTTNLEKLEFYGLADALTGDAPMIVRKSYYYSALMTAEAFRSRIFRNNLNGDREVYTDLTTYFPVKEETIDSQDTVRFVADFYKGISGRIGVTTLLLTESKRVALLLQGASKAVGANLANLGGSGSINYEDLDLAKRPPDFRDVLTYAMARELATEAGVGEQWIEDIRSNTMITGFFRWIDRAGHPEFTGLTRAGSVPFSTQHHVDHDEVERYEEIPITINMPEDFYKVLAYVRDKEINVALASLMALHRMSIIARYNTGASTTEQRQIYRKVARFISGEVGI